MGGQVLLTPPLLLPPNHYSPLTMGGQVLPPNYSYYLLPPTYCYCYYSPLTMGVAGPLLQGVGPPWLPGYRPLRDPWLPGYHPYTTPSRSSPPRRRSCAQSYRRRCGRLPLALPLPLTLTPTLTPTPTPTPQP